MTAAGSTVPLIPTRTPPDNAISIEPVAGGSATGLGSLLVPGLDLDVSGRIATGTRSAGNADGSGAAGANCRRHLNGMLAFRSCRRATIETEHYSFETTLRGSTTADAGAR